jgi:hypothetical protein
MAQRRWWFARQLGAALVLIVVAWPASAGTVLPAITFTPAAPTSNAAVTANLPFQICAWTVVRTPRRIDINYVAAPCSSMAFTDKIPLGRLAPGTYTVAVNLQPFQGSAIPQAIGTLGVTAAAVAATPVLSPAGLLLCALGVLALAASALRERAAPVVPRRTIG